jgi:uncharacterized membrane protein YkvA (DUF1232 family)
MIENWKERVKSLKGETYTLYLAYKHPLTPWYAKAFAGLVIAYAFSPIDLIPDFIPVLGYLDDMILIPFGIALALKMIPEDVMTESRTQAQNDLAEGKPVNRIAGVVIVLIWIALAALGILWLSEFVKNIL